MSNEVHYRGEYIIKAKNTQVEYEMTRKFDFKYFIQLEILAFLFLIIFFETKLEIQHEIFNPFDINNKQFFMIGLLIIISTVCAIEIVIYDITSKLRKIKLNNNSIFLKLKDNEYKIPYENLINIRIGVNELGRYGINRKYRFRKYIYIYYLRNNNIYEFNVSFPRQNKKKIKEICSMFITNTEEDEIDLKQYYDVRTKEKEEFIKRTIMMK